VSPASAISFSPVVSPLLAHRLTTMATFSSTSFDTNKYAEARPTYPLALFDFIFEYHECGPDLVVDGKSAAETVSGISKAARWQLAVDLGCGTGQATVALDKFRRVIGVDPSEKMIDGARQYVSSSIVGIVAAATGQFEFVQSAAEKLEFIEDGSVDLVISAEAAHWFDWRRLWPELARILRTNGTVAFWGYSQLRLSRYPTLTPLIDSYSQGSDPLNSLGPYWQEPGRSVLDNHFLDIPSANEAGPNAFHSERRVYFTGDYHPSLPSPRPIILRKKMSWEGFESYLRSFSALHIFHERHPEDMQREDGDITTRFIRELKAEMTKIDEQQGRDARGSEEDLDVEWPMALVLVKRR